MPTRSTWLPPRCPRRWSACCADGSSPRLIAFTGAAMFGRYHRSTTAFRPWSSEVSGVENTHRSHENRLARPQQGDRRQLRRSLLSLDDYRAVWPALSDDVTPRWPPATTALDGGVRSHPGSSPQAKAGRPREPAVRTGRGQRLQAGHRRSLDVAYLNSQLDYLNTTVCAWLRIRPRWFPIRIFRHHLLQPLPSPR